MIPKTAKELRQLDMNQLIDECLKQQQNAIDWELRHKQVVMDANKIAADLARRSAQY